MTDDGTLSGALNSVLFVALGVVALVAGFSVLDGWLPRWIGIALVVGGAASLVARRLGASRRLTAVPQVGSVLVAGGLIARRGFRTGSVLWTVFGIGVAVAIALVLVFPDRLTLVWATLTATFGGAGLVLVTNGTLLTGVVLVSWSVVFVRRSYQNWSTTAD